MAFFRSSAGLKACATLLLVLLSAAGGEAAAAPAPAQRSSERRSADELRDRLAARYDILPLTRGIALRSKSRPALLIEIMNDGEIAIDGAPVSGRELRERLGADADLILQLSYLDADERRALVGADRREQTEAPPPHPPEPTHEPEAPHPPEDSEDRRVREHIGERVAVFGRVNVERDQVVDGQVVTVFGSSRIDGEVRDQVVSVFGSIELGPESRVDGDVTVVAGQLHRAPGSVVTGSAREIGLGGTPSFSIHAMPWWDTMYMFHPFSYTARLMGTVFRLILLMLLGAIALLIAREPVERIADRMTAEPLKAAVVGVLAELLFFPLLVLTCVILAITIIGIPLLLFVPFLIVGLLFVLLGGFIGAAYSIGGLASARLGAETRQPYVRLVLGIFIIFLPLLLSRLFGVVGGPMYIFAGVLALFAFLIEYVAWTMGFGAALMGMFERWRSSRRPADSVVTSTNSTDTRPVTTTDTGDSSVI
jgi:hypothetical protein